MKLLLASLLLLVCFCANAVAVKDKKFIDVSSNELQVTKVVYDFAKDGGAIGAYELAEATGDTVILGVYASGITSLDSAGDAVTIDLGVTGATTAWLSASAQSNFEAGDLTATATYVAPQKVADGGKVLMETKTATPTAGKILFTILSTKFGI